MKRWAALVVFSLLALAAGCSNRNEQPPDKGGLLSDGPAAEPVALEVSDLQEILASIDLAAADLTCFCEGAEETFPAENAIRAKDYLEELRAFTWEGDQPLAGWDGADLYRYQLTVPGAVLTAYQSGYEDARPLHVETGEGEGWFILPTITEPEEQYSWMLYDTLGQWYGEAQAAALYGGEGVPLTAEELDWFEHYTESTETYYDETWGGFIVSATPISCFFTSQYNDPRDMDAGAFLYYCPDQGLLEAGDEAEFRIVQEKADWRVGEDSHLASLEEMPVPCHRLPRSYINEILTKYAGITVEEMHTDWLKDALYIPETDCFYTFSSDFGPGSFLPGYGEKDGNIVTLWEAPSGESGDADMLVLQKDGENWQILSHCPDTAT